MIQHAWMVGKQYPKIALLARGDVHRHLNCDVKWAAEVGKGNPAGASAFEARDPIR
jgi:hypothetical protein